MQWDTKIPNKNEHALAESAEKFGTGIFSSSLLNLIHKVRCYACPMPQVLKVQFATAEPSRR